MNPIHHQLPYRIHLLLSLLAHKNRKLLSLNHNMAVIARNITTMSYMIIGHFIPIIKALHHRYQNRELRARESTFIEVNMQLTDAYLVLNWTGILITSLLGRIFNKTRYFWKKIMSKWVMVTPFLAFFLNGISRAAGHFFWKTFPVNLKKKIRNHIIPSRFKYNKNLIK